MQGPHRGIWPVTISVFIGLLLLAPMLLLPGSGLVMVRSSQVGVEGHGNSGHSELEKVAVQDQIALQEPVCASNPPSGVATVTVGTDPGLAAYDSGNGYIYVANAGSHNVSVISGTTLKATVSVGESPEFPTYDSGNGWIYVSNVGYHTIEALSGTTVEFLITVGANPQASAYDSGNGDVYVPNQGSNNVSVVSGTTVVATVNVGTSPSFAIYDSGNGYVYVGNSGGSNVSILSGTTLVGTVNVGSNPSYATYDSGNGYVYVSNVFSNSVSVINGTTLVGTVYVDGSPKLAAYDSGNGYVYVPNVGPNDVSVISGTTLVGTVSVGSIPEFAAYDSCNRYVYVANYDSESVSVISGTSVVATVPVGSDPSFVTYDSGNGCVYVTNEGSGNVSVIGVTASYSVTFTESGAPWSPYVFWWVTLNGAVEASNTTSSSISFGELNGTYSYTVGSIAGYASSPSSGWVTVNGMNVSLTVTFTAVSTYFVTFSEIGLAAGTSWTVTMGFPLSTNTSTMTFLDPNGTYAYTVGSVSGYTSSPSSGSVTLAGSSQTVVVTFNAFAPGTFAVTFTESGLPSGTEWPMSLAGPITGQFLAWVTKNSTTSSIVFAGLVNGTYAFEGDPVPGYSASPSSGILTVNGAPVSESVVFTRAPNTVTFTESGMPPAAGGGVAFNGGGLTPFDAGGTVRFGSLVNGSYNYTISAATGYYQLVSSNPSSPVTVNGSNVTVSVVFEAIYNVTFTETGVPVGYNWSVTLNGTMKTSNTTVSSIFFPEPNGTYSFTVWLANCGPDFCFIYYPTPSYGSVVVNGTAVSVAIAYHVPSLISFTESGLPHGTNWSVTVSGLTEASTVSYIYFLALNGTYNYTVASVAGYTSSPSSGSVTVAGQAQTVAVTFTAFAPGTFAVTFTETGLSPGTEWAVLLGGPGGTTLVSTASAITFAEPNGTYTYIVSEGDSWYPIGNGSGSLTVNGAAVGVSVMYAYTWDVSIEQTGIPNGTMWTVEATLTSGSPVASASGLGTSWLASSTGPTALLHLVNGTYSYVITASGYQTATGTFPVNGQPLIVPPVTVSPNSSSSGLPWWGYAVIGVVIAGIVVGVVIGLMRHRRPPATAASSPPPMSRS